ncbi:MAG: hypothetical protein ACOYYJ_22395 [Chloroflexota bacterium]
MEALIGYGILAFVFCVIPLLILVLVFFALRAARKPRQAAATRAVPVPRPAQTVPAPRPSQPLPANAAPLPGRMNPASIRASTGKKAPIYLTLGSQPLAILDGMDKLVAQTRQANASNQRWKLLPRLGFLGGLGMIAVDLLLRLLGYKSLVFSAGGVVIWIAAIVLSVILRRHHSAEFPNGYQTAREIIRTLRDDLKPGAPFLGHLDLTGYKQPAKVARETQDTQSRTTQHYRDEWLNLKAKLFDGNVLRVSAIQRAKIRKSYWKRSRISGKMKMKPEKFKGSLNELKVRIVVNPEVYQIVQNNQVAPDKSIGQYTISQVNTEGGILNLTAAAFTDEIQPESILNVLHSAYSLLQRKAV